MLNGKRKNMKIKNYFVRNNNASNHHDYWKSFTLAPPENETGCKGFWKIHCTEKKDRVKNDKLIGYGHHINHSLIQ